MPSVGEPGNFTPEETEGGHLAVEDSLRYYTEAVDDGFDTKRG